jgi:hypothetical protein
MGVSECRLGRSSGRVMVARAASERQASVARIVRRSAGHGRVRFISLRSVLAGFSSDMEDRVVEADRYAACASEPPDLYLVDALADDYAR